MNKVIQANLGGIAFTFDDDAYQALDNYLASINGYFRGTPGHADIMHDIEARLSELFVQNLKGRSIVTQEDVGAATATLGTPEQVGGASAEFDGEDTDAAGEGAANAHQNGEQQRHQRRRRPGRQGYTRYGKKLMRDPEEKVVGGVCSGISAYFGIDNPVWIRIAAAAGVFFTGGTVLVVYLVLWAALPQPRTAGDRLAMRGEPIDIDGISRQVEHEVHGITNKLQEWGDEVNRTDWSGKWKDRRNGWSKRPKRSSRRRNEEHEHDSMS